MKRIFLFIFLSYFLFFFLIPPLQTPDESGHYEVVYWITQGKYPVVYENFRENPRPYTKDFAALFNIGINHPMLIPNFQAVKQSTLQRETAYPTSRRKQFIAESPQAYNPPLYYATGAIFLKTAQLLHLNFFTQYYLTRLASALFYFTSVLFAYKILSLLFRKKTLVYPLLIFFALNPLFLKSAVAINPDIALTCLSTIFLFYLLQWHLQKSLQQTSHLLFLGLLAGLATLTKLSGIFLVPTLLTLLLLQRKTIKKLLTNCFLFLTPFLLTQIPWAILNFLRYRKLVPSEIALGPATRHLATSIPVALVSGLFEFRHTFMHFAGFLGWNDVYPFPVVFTLYTIFFAALLSIGIYIVLKNKDMQKTILVIFFFWLFLFFYALSLQRKLFYPGWDIQGRYMLPVFLPMTLFLSIGLARLFKRTLEHAAPWLMYFAIFYYYFILVFVLLPRYYV